MRGGRGIKSATKSELPRRLQSNSHENSTQGLTPAKPPSTSDALTESPRIAAAAKRPSLRTQHRFFVLVRRLRATAIGLSLPHSISSAFSKSLEDHQDRFRKSHLHTYGDVLGNFPSPSSRIRTKTMRRYSQRSKVPRMTRSVRETVEHATRLTADGIRNCCWSMSAAVILLLLVLGSHACADSFGMMVGR